MTSVTAKTELGLCYQNPDSQVDGDLDHHSPARTLSVTAMSLPEESKAEESSSTPPPTSPTSAKPPTAAASPKIDAKPPSPPATPKESERKPPSAPEKEASPKGKQVRSLNPLSSPHSCLTASHIFPLFLCVFCLFFDRRSLQPYVPVVTKATIDMENFQQILDLDEEDSHEFSQGMVWAYFTQAKQTFIDMDNALSVLSAYSTIVNAVC